VAPALDANLAGLYKAFDAVGTNTLPIVNKALKDLPGVRDAINPAVRAKLKAAIVALETTATRDAVTDALWSALGTGGLNVIGDTDGNKAVDKGDVLVSFPDANSVDIRFDLSKTSTIAGDFGLGLPGIPLQTDAVPAGARSGRPGRPRWLRSRPSIRARSSFRATGSPCIGSSGRRCSGDCGKPPRKAAKASTRQARAKFCRICANSASQGSNIARRAPARSRGAGPRGEGFHAARLRSCRARAASPAVRASGGGAARQP